MRAGIFGICMALGCAAGLSAQSATVKQETRIEVEDGKEVVLTGCLGRSASGDGFVLTNVEGREDDEHARAYFLVGEEDDLSEHLGHLVEIEGKATDEDGELEVTTRTTVERDDADDKETETKTEIEGDLSGAPYLGVEEVRMIRTSCN